MANDGQIYGFGQQTAIRLHKLSGKIQKGFKIEGVEQLFDTGAPTAFFILQEDMPDGHGAKAWSSIFSWEGYINDAYVYNWGAPAVIAGGSTAGMLDDAKKNYWGMCILQEDRWTFVQGPCVPSAETEGYMTYISDLPQGTVGVAYSYIPSVGGLNNDISASGLPTGLSVNATTGEISGTPSQSGLFTIEITASAPLVGQPSNTILTVVRYLLINE